MLKTHKDAVIKALEPTRYHRSSILLIAYLGGGEEFSREKSSEDGQGHSRKEPKAILREGMVSRVLGASGYR